MPFFSIVTVSFNSAAAFRASGSSLLARHYQDWERIIMDGGSTDGTLHIIRAMVPDESRLRLTSGPDDGIIHAMNDGVARSKGKFVYFLNSDDCPAGFGGLKEVAATLTAHPSVDFLYGDARQVPPAPGNALKRRNSK